MIPISKPWYPADRHDIERCSYWANFTSLLPLYIFYESSFVLHPSGGILPFYTRNMTPRTGRASYGPPNSQQRPISSNHNSIQSQNSSRPKTKDPIPILSFEPHTKPQPNKENHSYLHPDTIPIRRCKQTHNTASNPLHFTLQVTPSTFPSPKRLPNTHPISFFEPQNVPPYPLLHLPPRSRQYPLRNRHVQHLGLSRYHPPPLLTRSSSPFPFPIHPQP